MCEEIENMKAKKSCDKTNVGKIWEEKERVGLDVVAAAMEWWGRLGPDYCSDRKGNASDLDETSHPAERQKHTQPSAMCEKLAIFGEQLKESDLTRVSLEREQSALERERFVAEHIERA